MFMIMMIIIKLTDAYFYASYSLQYSLFVRAQLTSKQTVVTSCTTCFNTQEL